MGHAVSSAPQSTYRLQLHAHFGFDDVSAIADYLERLGISHVYCSPFLQAAAGSTHGYDVVDPHKVNAELGGAEAHARMGTRLGEAGLGQVLDIVPNHMSIADRANRWWWDVLENGQSSPYASYFDVEWHPPEAKLRNIVLLPILGDHYGRVLEAREIRLEREGGSFWFRYHERTVPVAPRSLDHVLASAAERSQNDSLAFIADALGRLPLSTATDRTSIARRHRDKEVLRQQLARLSAENPQVCEALDQVVAEINVEVDALDALLERQNYRVAFWRTAVQELGYRRFFDINNLVSLRMEDQQVFADTHALVLDWLRRGVIDGVRIDHPDGLRDPDEYFQRLREAAPHAWIVAEKILEPGEALPTAWPVAGTTGYDFIQLCDGVFLDPAGEQPLTEFYERFTGESSDYSLMVYQKKHLVLHDLFGSDINRLADLLSDVCERHRRYRDYTRLDLEAVLREFVASLPVYRTYVRPYLHSISEADNGYIQGATEQIKARRPDLDPDLLHFLRDLLTLRIRGELESEFVARLQQLSGAVMAKGVEDTTFYCYSRLLSLNEVGSDPGLWGVSPGQFHEACTLRQQEWPQAMLASSTHDTKRGEDVRVRIALIAQMPDAWAGAVRRWSDLNQTFWRAATPDRNLEYFFYQTLFGAWPLSIERAWPYLEKAIREAKRFTAWTHVDAAYEDAVHEFVERVLRHQPFLGDFQAFLEPCLPAAYRGSLAQTLVKLTAPGVPDTYQGSELWDLSLVDPDNRRPVDYALRRRMLAEAETLSAADAWRRAGEGMPKLWLLRKVLRLRREMPAPFSAESSYRPLTATGPQSNRVVAFARGDQVATVVPRLGLKPVDWKNTFVELPGGNGRWHNVLDGVSYATNQLACGNLLASFPVALLVRQAD